jgi:hypothetical protein
MCFVAVQLNSLSGKSAGERRHWQAAKTKNRENRAPEIPRPGAGRRAHRHDSGWRAMKEGRPTSSEARRPVQNPRTSARLPRQCRGNFFEDFSGVFIFLCYIPALLTNRI